MLVGGALVNFLFVGAPGGKPMPGSTISRPDLSGNPPGTAVVELDEQFFNTLLGTVFKDLGELTFRCARAESRAPDGAGDPRYVPVQGGCQNQVVVATPRAAACRRACGWRMVRCSRRSPSRAPTTSSATA